MPIQHYTKQDARLITLAEAILRDPRSWQKWTAFKIRLIDVPQDEHNDYLLWARSLMDAYFHDIEHSLFFSENDEIHAFCKNAPRELLKTAKNQIARLAVEEAGIPVDIEIYHFPVNAHGYVHDIVAKTNDFEDHSFTYGIDSHDSAEPARTEFAQSRVRALLVEDDPVTRWMVRNALKNHCDFASADCANRAFDVFKSFLPDIVFLDVNLPDKNGLSVLDWIIRHDPGACVVMLSAKDDLDNITYALEEGARGFVPKPFLTQDLLHYLNTYAAGA